MITGESSPVRAQKLAMMVTDNFDLAQKKSGWALLGAWEYSLLMESRDKHAFEMGDESRIRITHPATRMVNQQKSVD